MSHGPSAEGSVAEPNLTPLLDVVLQLLMFFMMCVNFVTEQVNQDIVLPESQAAKPMDKAEADVLFLNLKTYSDKAFRDKYSAETMARLESKNFREGDPTILVPGMDPQTLTEAKYWLKQQYETAEEKSKTAEKPADRGKVKTAIIIRSDKDATYENVYRLLQMCKGQGFTRLRLRAITKNVRVGGNS